MEYFAVPALFFFVAVYVMQKVFRINDICDRLETIESLLSRLVPDEKLRAPRDD